MVNRIIASPQHYATELLILGPVGAGFIIGLAGLYRLLLSRLGKHWQHSERENVVLDIQLPPEIHADAARMFWTNAHDLLRPRWTRLFYGQPHLGFEMVWQGLSLKFRIWVPGALDALIVERAIRAAWPGSIVTKSVAPAVVSGNDRYAAGSFGVVGDATQQWQTSYGIDPLRFISESIGDLAETEGAAVQVLCRPLTSKEATKRLHGSGGGLAQRLALSGLDFITPGPTPVAAPKPLAAKPQSVPISWDVNVNYVVTSNSDDNHDEDLRNRAHGLASAFSVLSGDKRLARRRLRKADRVLNERRLTKPFLASVDELATVAHLPESVTTTGASQAGAATVLPGPLVPTEGKRLGRSSLNGGRAVALKPEDSRFHVHMMGATGVGKSTLLANMVLQDVAAQRGAVVIDPKGDLVLDIIERLPDEARQRTLLIDPINDGVLPSLDVLGGGKDSPLVIENLAGIFRKVFSAYWGPRTDDVFRSACLTLAAASEEDQPASLEDIPRLLIDQDFRSAKTKKAYGQAGIKSFWDSYEAMTPVQQMQLVGPLLNKLRAFLTREFVRRAVCPGGTAIDMASVLDGGLLLVRIPKGILGDEVSRLIGSLVVAKVWQTALARMPIAEAKRRDAALYVDECQNFMNLPGSFDDILAEARGYHLSLVLAHQHLGQLDRDLRDGLGANARNKVWFSMAPDDARILERNVAPELSMHDLSNLSRYQFVAQVMADGDETRPFTAFTEQLPTRNEDGLQDLLSAIERQGGSTVNAVKRTDVSKRLRQGPQDPARQPGRQSPRQSGRQS